MSRLTNQASNCGERLSLMCDSLSPVCRTYTVAPESHAHSVGLLSIVDMILVVFAIGTKLPSLLSTAPSSSSSQDAAAASAAVHATLSGGASGGGLWTAAEVHLFVTDFVRNNVMMLGLLALLLARVAYRLLTRVPAERLTVVRNVGLQLHREGVFGGWQPTELIDVGTITGLVIHEGFLRHRVVFFLAVSCQDRPRLVLPFHATMPRLPILRTVLRGARAVLYGEPETGPTLAELEEKSKRATTM